VYGGMSSNYNFSTEFAREKKNRAIFGEDVDKRMRLTFWPTL